MFNIFKKRPIIEFMCLPEFEDSIPEPTLASKKVPDWFKKIDVELEYRRDQFGAKAFTAKKCVPMLDAFTTGFIIPVQFEINVITNHDLSIMKVTDSRGLHGVEGFSHHDSSQLGGKNQPHWPSIPIKFHNKWIIKTAPGWSTLFVPPLNHFNENFEAMSGIVHTDDYINTVNFPCIWKKPNFDGRVKVGTPLVQVIPFKRTSKNSDFIRKITENEFQKYLKYVKRFNYGSTTYKGIEK